MIPHTVATIGAIVGVIGVIIIIAIIAVIVTLAYRRSKRGQRPLAEHVINDTKNVGGDIGKRKSSTYVLTLNVVLIQIVRLTVFTQY